MLIIETPQGNFGRFEDVLQFMEEEGVTEIQMTVKYNFSQIGFRSMTYTSREIQEILDNGGNS